MAYVSKKSKIDYKAREFVEDLLLSKAFKKKITEYREWLGLPLNGLSILVYDRLVVDGKYPRIPSGLDRKGILQGVEKILSVYNLSLQWREFFLEYLLYGWVGDMESPRQIMIYKIGPRNKTFKETKKQLDQLIQKEAAPIALILPQSITAREFEDFLKQNIKLIKEIQRKYSTTFTTQIKKTRKRNTRIMERNGFIYKNRKLPKLALMTLVSEKYDEFLDYTYLNRIIKEEGRKKSAGI